MLPSSSCLTWTILTTILMMVIRLVSSHKLVPSPDHCLNDGYFCFEVTNGSTYSYQVWPNDPDVLFSIYAVRKERKGDFFTHSWNMSLDATIDQADVFLQFQQLNEPHPALKIEVKKIPDFPVIFEFYLWDNGAWVKLEGNKIWEQFADLSMEMHSFTFDTTEKVDQELGLESKNLTIHFQMEINKVNGTDHNLKMDFTTNDGARYIFGDKSALRPLYQKENEGKGLPPPSQSEEEESSSGTVIAASLIAALLIVAAIAVAVYRCRS